MPVFRVVEQRIAEIDFASLTAGRPYFPSPAAWEDNFRTAWVTVDAHLHAAGSHLTYKYSTDGMQIGTTTAIESRNGRAALVTLPPAGFAILE